MTSSEPRKPYRRRRFGWLTAFIVLLFGGYSAGWFYVADMIESRAGQAIKSFSGNGREAECTKLSAEGFPFRIGLWCDSVRYEDARFALTAESFRSAAQVYDPFHVVAELDSPATFDLPAIGPVKAAWDNLRASVRADYDFPERASFELTGLNAEPGRNQGSLTLTSGQAHMQRSGDNLDLALSFSGARAAGENAAIANLPPLDGELILTLNNGVKIALHGGGSPRGWSGTIRTLSLSTGQDTGLSVSGPIAIDEQGLVNANLMIGIRNPAAISGILQAIFPKAGNLSALAALGNTQLPLNIVSGQASLSFIPLGAVPRL
jgi:hypothetical protein